MHQLTGQQAILQQRLWHCNITTSKGGYTAMQTIMLSYEESETEWETELLFQRAIDFVLLQLIRKHIPI